MKLLKYRPVSPGTCTLIDKEEILDEIKFRKFKFNDKQLPKDKTEILFITCFSEFGCESLALMYCIPKIIEKNPGLYVICVGWYGRQYLYKHLVDEFWEIEESAQWLREYSLAFRTTSKNITKLERELEKLGNVYKGENMGQICLGNTCRICKNFWGESGFDLTCPNCKSKSIDKALLNDIPFHKTKAVKIPRPSEQTVQHVQKYLKPNSVGIFARNRVCYGRNLSPEFYTNLIKFLKLKGYNPIWLGERQSVLPCPVEDITDFSITEDADNLEYTLALISCLEFTVQFWTASTRLASMVDTPWILFESPEQIVGQGQEGIRIALTSSYDKKKIIFAQYKKVMENELLCLDILERAIHEIKNNNWNDIIGLVDNPDIIKTMLDNQNPWR